MANLSLVKPSVIYENEYLDMFDDWKKNDGDNIPWFINIDTDFSSMVDKLEGFSKGLGLDKGFVENSTFWLVDSNRRVIGVINIRHRLNEFLMNYGGHIGYGIRPGERRKGYAKEILRLGLDVVIKMGFKRVLLCCNKDNMGSVLTIVRNGGILDSEGIFDGRVFQRYWISLS